MKIPYTHLDSIKSHFDSLWIDAFMMYPDDEDIEELLLLLERRCREMMFEIGGLKLTVEQLDHT